MNYYIFIPLSALLINIVLIIYTYLMGRPRKTVRSFILWVMCIIAWELLDVICWSGISDEAVMLTHKILAPFVFFCWIFLLDFLYQLLGKKRNIFFYTAMMAAAAATILLYSSELYITEKVVRTGWGIAPTPGPLYMPLMIMMGPIPMVYSSILLWYYSRKATRSMVRTQLTLLSVSFALMVLIGTVMTIILPFIFGNYRYPRVASSMTILLSIFTVIAIARYKFLSISDRHVSEGMLRQIEDGIVLLDTDGYVIETNRKAEAILGIDGSNIQETRGEDLFAGNYPPEPEVKDREIVLDSGGKPLNILVTKILIKQKNKPVGTLVVLQDITIRKRTEEALIREFNFKEAIINSSPAFLCTLTPAGEIISMNNSMLQALGYSAEEVKGRNFLAEFVPAHDREPLAEVFQRITKGHEQAVFEGRIIAGDGRELLAEWHGRPVFNVKRELDFFITVGIDITQRRRMEEELIRTYKLESLGVFAGGIAHDFNNLLTVMTGNLSIAMQGAPGPDTAAMLGEIDQAAQRARDLTQQLLVFSKGGDPVIRETSIREVLVDTVEYVMRGSRIKAEFSIPDDLWIVKADAGQIRQVVKNLAMNALEAMPGGGVITITAENCAGPMGLPSGEYIRIALQDTGAGIAESDMKNIFDPYFSTKPGGQGLGLSIAASILKKHGGRITASSRPGKGSLFEIFLPAAGRHADRNETGSGDKITKPWRVLLMDDEELILSLGERMLAHLGCEAACAANGDQAISLYKKAKATGRPFDLVIMDLTIPNGMGGLEAVQILKDYDKDLLAVVSSGYSNDPIMANYLDYGFCDVLTKPYRIRDVEEMLSRAMRNRAPISD